MKPDTRNVFSSQIDKPIAHKPVKEGSKIVFLFDFVFYTKAEKFIQKFYEANQETILTY